MTTRQLNADITKLHNYVLGIKQKNNEEFFKDLQGYVTTEFKRLYYAGKDFKDLSKKSILILFKLNLSYRFIALHQFGIYIEI